MKLKIRLLYLFFGISFFVINSTAQVNPLTGLPEKDVEIVSISTKSGLKGTVNLIYKAPGVTVAAQARNDENPTSWTGLGWALTFPSIFVDHRGTTDLNDDHWFYKDGGGNVTEIFRVPEADANGNLISESFYLKSNPYWKITAIDNTPGTTKIRKIIGWEIIDRDGTKYYFGALDNAVTDANRRIIHWDNMVYKGIPGGTAGTHYDDFYYQWDLKQVKDINNSTLTYSYTQPAATVNGYSYTKESYVSRIESDNGDVIEFTLGTKHSNEGRVETFQGDFDFTETNYLDKVTYKRKGTTVLEDVKFIYSDPAGIAADKNINWNQKGFSKRLLLRLEPQTSKAINFKFTYNPDNWLLDGVTDLKMGGQLKYEFSDEHITTNIETMIPLESTYSNAFDKTKTIKIGQHIFFKGEYTVNNPAGGELVYANRIEIVTKINGKWVRNHIEGLTGQSFIGGQILPGENKLIIIKDHGAFDWSSHDVMVYEFNKFKWEKTFETTIPLKITGIPGTVTDKIILQGGTDYFTIYETYRSIIYAYNKINGIWVSTFNSPGKPNGCNDPAKCGTITGLDMVFGNDNKNGDGTGNGWHWPDLPINNPYHTQENILCNNGHFFYKRNTKTGNTEITIANNFWWDVIQNKWIQRSYGQNAIIAEFNGYTYRRDAFLGNKPESIPILVQAGTTWFCSDVTTNISSKYYYNYEWSPIAKQWQMAGEFNGNSTFKIGVAYPGLFYRTKNYIMYLEYERFVTQNLNNVSSGLRIYKITGDDIENGTARDLKPMYISPTNVNDPTITKRFGGGDRTFMKWFNVDIDRIIVRDDYFIVLNKYHEYPSDPWCPNCVPRNPGQIPTTDNMIWVYRWNPDLGTNGMWESVLNGTTGNTDNDGQGLILDEDVREITAQDDYFTAWCNTTDQTSGNQVAKLKIYQYNYKTKTYSNTITKSYDNGIDKFKHYFTNDLWVENQKYYYGAGANDNIQAAVIRERHNRSNGILNWFDASTLPLRAPVVANVVTNAQFESKITTSYEYDGTTNQFEPYTNTPSFKNVKIIQNAGQNSFSKEYEFLNDTLATLFGKPKTIKSFNSDGQLVASEENEWEIHEKSISNKLTMYVPRLIQKNENVNGLKKSTVWPSDYFNDVNGAPALVYTKNSDGTLLVNKTIFAHSVKTGMQNKHMLAQQAGQYTYKIASLYAGDWNASNVIINESTNNITIPLQTLNEGDVLDISFTIGAADQVHHIFGFSFPDLVEYRLKVGAEEKVKLQDIVYSTNQKAMHINYKLNAADVSAGSPALSLNFYGYERRLKIAAIKVTATKEKLDNDVDAIKGSAVTWAPDSRGVWRPAETYNWNVDCDENGNPTTTFVPYFENPTNTYWKYTGKASLYNKNGAVVESQDAKNIPSVNVYRADIGLEIANVTKAKFAESGVFTCDYDLDEDGYFDKENLWLHHDEATLLSGAVCQVEPTFPHFGQKSLHVKNSKAAARKVVVGSRTAIITRSAWVRPVTTNPIRFAACLVVDGVGNTNIVYDYVYNTSDGLKADGTWQLVKFDIDISKPTGNLLLPAGFDGVGDDGIYTWIGNHPDETVAEFYIDDIRIYPKNALVTSTYYDQKWYQPILSIDANNKPSQRVTYDEFGRPYLWEKIDLTKSANSPNYAVKVMEKEYHLMGANASPNVPSNFAITANYPSITITFNGGDPDGDFDDINYRVQMIMINSSGQPTPCGYEFTKQESGDVTPITVTGTPMWNGNNLPHGNYFLIVLANDGSVETRGDYDVFPF